MDWIGFRFCIFPSVVAVEYDDLKGFLLLDPNHLDARDPIQSHTYAYTYTPWKRPHVLMASIPSGAHSHGKSCDGSCEGLGEISSPSGISESVTEVPEVTSRRLWYLT